MSAKIRQEMPSDSNEHRVTRRDDLDWMLAAIANAIAVGRLPPDDACAWARIAVSEVEMLGVAGVISLAPQRQCRTR
jgi:hypothetical protein